MLKSSSPIDHPDRPVSKDLGSTGRELRDGILELVETPLLESLDEIDGVKFSFEVLLSAHGTSRDLWALRERIKHASVFIPEAGGYEPGRLESYREISDAEWPIKFLRRCVPKKQEFREAGLEMLSIIHGTNVPLTLIDVPAEKIAALAVLREQAHTKKPIRRWPSQKAVAESRKHVAVEAEISIGRGSHMISQLAPQLRALLEKHPELKEKQPVHVLLQLGSHHVAEWLAIKARCQNATLTVGDKPHVSTHGSDMYLKYMSGDRVSDEFAARALVGALFHAHLAQPFLPRELNMCTTTAIKVVREVESAVDPNAALAVVGQIYEQTSTGDELSDRVVRNIIERSGIAADVRKGVDKIASLSLDAMNDVPLLERLSSRRLCALWLKHALRPQTWKPRKDV